MTTDTSEKGLETLVMRHMTGIDGFSVVPGAAGKNPETAGTGYFAGSPKDFDRAYAMDVPQLFAFLLATQPEVFKKLAMADAGDPKDINRVKFLARLSTEIGKRGVIDVVRKGVDHGPLHFDLFYGTPSPGNAKAEALHAQNRFSITRQLGYSTDETRRALDLCLFINGLPIATFTVMILQLNYLLSGIIVTEVFFSYDGFGKAIYDAALFGDIYVVLSGSMIAVFVAVLSQFISDLGYTYLNPRIRFA